MAILLVMCGLQCSGKSTEIVSLSQKYNATVLSSDQLRKEHPEWNNDTVFKTLYARMNNLLSLNTNVILDATNITIKSRRQIFLNLKEQCHKICYIMNTPFNVCKARLQIRNKVPESHFVPEEVLDRYHESFEIPFYEEGWDEIIVHNEVDQETAESTLSSLIKAANGFDQKNKHHTQDLGQHMKTVGDLLREWTDSIIMATAGYYHDVGKLFTQTVGQDGNCHYYNHDSVGAYSLLCTAGWYNGIQYADNKPQWLYDTKTTLKWLFYIDYHMRLHNVVTDKSIKKWKNIFGEELYNKLRLFEKADKFRG